MSKIEECIINCGFLPPDSTYRKPDPRGVYYGLFEVRVVESVSALLGHKFLVTKLDGDGDYDYEFAFTSLSDFRRWAGDCT